MEKNVVRYGIIGCGDHALRSHAVPGHGVPELELAAIFDPDFDRARRFALDPGIRRLPNTYGSEGELLADPDVDAVVICSPDRFHAESLFRAVSARKHVLVEKPIADSEDALNRVLKALALASWNGNRIVTSCHPRRFNPPYVWAKERLPELVEAHGKVLALETNFTYHRPSKTGLHKGLLIDHINHEYDLMCFLLGPSPYSALKIEDSQTRYQAIGMRHDGVTFSFRGSRELEERRYPEWLLIRFEQATLEISTETGGGWLHDHRSGLTTALAAPKTDYETAFRGIMRNFARSILGLEENYLTQQEIFDNTRIGIELTEDTMA